MSDPYGATWDTAEIITADKLNGVQSDTTGVLTTDSDGVVTVTFPLAYASAPVVVVARDAGGTDTERTAHVVDVTTTGFSARCFWGGAAQTSTTGPVIHWVAVGELAATANGGVVGTASGSVPTGGSSGQVLAKASATDFDTEWVDQSGGGGGGADGDGWTGGSYDAGTGVVTFTSDDGLGFSTGDLRGADGADGAPGAKGDTGDPGADGADGQGVPTGGTTNQVLAKASGTNYDTQWVDLAGGGDMLAANNLSDVANAGTARTNLGVEIGSDVQAHSAVLDATTASFTTADETKLDGIEAGADVTDATNVAAAGAVMTSDTSAALTEVTAATESGTTDTLAAGNQDQTTVYSNASLVTVTVPTNASVALPVGFRCLLFAAGAGGLTLSTSGITLLGSSPNTTVAQNEALYLEKTDTDTWLVAGGTS